MSLTKENHHFRLTSFFTFVIFIFILFTACCIGGYGQPNRDIGLIKVDHEGQYQWHKLMDSGQDDYAEFLVQTNDGGYVIPGFAAKKGAVDPHPRIIKLDPEGSLQWDREYPQFLDGLKLINQTPNDDYFALTDWGWVLHFDFEGRFISNESANLSKIFFPDGEKTIFYGLFPKIRTATIPVQNNEFLAAGFRRDDGYSYSAHIHGDAVELLKLKDNGQVIWNSSLDTAGKWTYIQYLIQTRDSGYAILVINSNL